MNLIVAAILVAFVFGTYVMGYILNSRTPYPEGVVPILSCEICTTHCYIHPDNVTADLKKALADLEKSPDCKVL
jgi:hypothetical protein